MIELITPINCSGLTIGYSHETSPTLVFRIISMQFASSDATNATVSFRAETRVDEFLFYIYHRSHEHANYGF